MSYIGSFAIVVSFIFKNQTIFDKKSEALAVNKIAYYYSPIAENAPLQNIQSIEWNNKQVVVIEG
jgi:hypothetical protein